MPRRHLNYKPTTQVTCSDNGKSVTAQVISFVPEQRLVISLENSIRVEMIYNPNLKLYMTKMSGLEFASNGPEIIDIDRFR